MTVMMTWMISCKQEDDNDKTRDIDVINTKRVASSENDLFGLGKIV